ncbi:MAG TPA: EamA family transporter [Chitinispirillaceae bacterium]|nr:EamA family transporter [Chitinispirillaceae bacterium]
MKKDKNAALIILNYLLVYIIWGSTYFFIKIAVSTIPPFHVIGLRFFGGGLFFLLIALISGRLKKLPTIKETLTSMLLGGLLLLGGTGLVTTAEKKVDSYLAALIISTTPVAVAFFDRILLKKRLSIISITGIVIGISGVGLLLYNGHSLAKSFSLEVILIIIGLTSWSFATSLGHVMKTPSDSIVNSCIQILSVGILCMLILLFTKPSVQTLFPTFSMESLYSVAMLSFIGSLGFLAYTFLIHNEPAIRVVSYAFVNPMIAVILGLIIGKEKPVPFLIPGIVLILTGLFQMLYGDMFFRKLKKFVALQRFKNFKVRIEDSTKCQQRQK